MLTKADIPNYAPETIELPNGWTAEIHIEDDPDGELSACAQDHSDEPCASQTGPWIGVIAVVRDAEGEVVSDGSLWGIEEDCGDYWREVAADLINEACAGLIMPTYAAVREENTSCGTK